MCFSFSLIYDSEKKVGDSLTTRHLEHHLAPGTCPCYAGRLSGQESTTAQDPTNTRDRVVAHNAKAHSLAPDSTPDITP